MFRDKLRVSLLPDRVPTLSLHSGIVSSPRLRWVKGVCAFRCNLPPALWQNGRGLLRATAVTRGWERTPPNESQHRKLNLEKKILPPVAHIPDINDQTISHELNSDSFLLGIFK